MFNSNYAPIETLDKKEIIALRAHVWRETGLRLRYVCKQREACTWVLKRHTSKAFRVLGAEHVCAKVKRVSEALYWASVYNVKKGK